MHGGMANDATFKKFHQKIRNFQLWWDLNPGPLPTSYPIDYEIITEVKG